MSWFIPRYLRVTKGSYPLMTNNKTAVVFIIIASLKAAWKEMIYLYRVSNVSTMISEIKWIQQLLLRIPLSFLNQASLHPILGKHYITVFCKLKKKYLQNGLFKLKKNVDLLDHKLRKPIFGELSSLYLISTKFMEKLVMS